MDITSTDDGLPPGGFGQLTAELLVSDLPASMHFWCDILQFRIAYARPAQGFVYLYLRNGAQIMLSTRHGNWETGELQAPFGRGVMFQLDVDDLDEASARLEAEGWPLYAGPREVWRDAGKERIGQREIFVQDPDGYLLMLAKPLPG